MRDPEKLLNHLLSPETGTEQAALEHLLNAARRKRRRRTLVRSASLLALLAFAIALPLLLLQEPERRKAPPASGGLVVHYLSDEELAARFGEQPVILVAEQGRTTRVLVSLPCDSPGGSVLYSP